MKLQVTFFHNEGNYKPVSTVVEIESMEYYNQHKAEVQKRAIENIAHYRRMLPSELIKQGYTRVKVREYDLEKIKAQQEYQHRVNLIKKMYEERKSEGNGKNTIN